MLVCSPPLSSRSVFGALIAVALFCPTLWAEIPSSIPRALTARWKTQVSAQITGLDLSWDGQTVALTVAPLTPETDSYLSIYDFDGHEMWTASRRTKILGVSLAEDGKYVAVGTLDSSAVLFSMDGKFLWERQSVGLPFVTPQESRVVAFNGGVASVAQPLLEVFLPDGETSWNWRRKGRVWRSVVSDQRDLLLGLWNGEVLLIDRQYHLAWQRTLPKEIMALAISPEDARYFAIGAGVLNQELYLFERTGRLVWRRKLPLGITELSLSRRGEFLLTYGNTIRGQHLALYRRNGERQWTYHLEEPASESSKAVIVPAAPLIVAGIEYQQQYSLQGFTLSGERLWTAPLPGPIFDFRVSRDGRYIAAATDSALYFFDTHTIERPKAELQPSLGAISSVNP
jgi:outer membrane protein assembly factor BamB